MENEQIFKDEYSNEWRKLTKLYEFGVQEIHTKIKILTEELYVFYRQAPVEHIKTRVKTPQSIIRKLKKRNIKPTPENAKKYLTDIAGIRIICSFTSDIYKIFEMLENQNDIQLIKYKDYIENPKKSGYQSLHMIISIPVFLSNSKVDVPVEIQIRTIAMDFWASLEHKLKYKYDEKAPIHIEDELRDCAMRINDLDSRMLKIKNEIDNFTNKQDEITEEEAEDMEVEYIEG